MWWVENEIFWVRMGSEQGLNEEYWKLSVAIASTCLNPIYSTSSNVFLAGGWRLDLVMLPSLSLRASVFLSFFYFSETFLPPPQKKTTSLPFYSLWHTLTLSLPPRGVDSIQIISYSNSTGETRWPFESPKYNGSVPCLTYWPWIPSGTLHANQYFLHKRAPHLREKMTRGGERKR
jgi:hypothetical protein